MAVALAVLLATRVSGVPPRSMLAPSSTAASTNVSATLIASEPATPTEPVPAPDVACAEMVSPPASVALTVMPLESRLPLPSSQARELMSLKFTATPTPIPPPSVFEPSATADELSVSMAVTVMRDSTTSAVPRSGSLVSVVTAPLEAM